MAREPLADAFFGFPPTAEADLDFVADMLGFLDYPALVVDKHLRIVTANLQGRDAVAWIRSVTPGSEDTPQDVLPPKLAEVVGPRRRRRVHEIVKNVTVIDEPPFLFDVFLSKGRVLGQTFTVVILMTASAGRKTRRGSALGRLLGGFKTGAFAMDADVKFAFINDSFLDIIGFSSKEIIGHHMNEFNTSEQAKAYGKIFAGMIREPRVLRSPAITYSTIRRGRFVSPITAWTITDKDGRGLGIAVVGGFRSRPRAETASVERRHILLEKAADLMSEAIFITDLDGDVLVKNPAADCLIAVSPDKDRFNIRTDVPWEIPDTLEGVFTGLAGGKDQFLYTTAVNMPGRKAVVKVRVFALRRVSDIVQEIVFVCKDISEEEYLKQTLFQTTRRLAEDRALRDRVLDSVDIPFAVLDEAFTVIQVNEATQRRFGRTEREIIGRKLTDVNPNVAHTGLLDHVREALETKKVLRSLGYGHVTHEGQRVSITMTFVPVELGGRPVCVVIAEREAPSGGEGKWAEQGVPAEVGEIVIKTIHEGVFIVDRAGTFLEANEGALRGSSLSREQIVGKNVRDLIALSDDEDLFKALWRRVLTTDEPFRSGVIKSRTRADGLEQFVDIAVTPLKAPDGTVEKYVVIVEYLREIKDLEHQVQEYTFNLENMVAAKTRELSDSNALLASTAERVARVARSGEIMMALADRDTVIDSFIRQARDVLRADSVTLALRDNSIPQSEVEVHSRGTGTERTGPAREIVDEAMSRMMLDSAVTEKVWAPLDSLLVAEFESGSEKAVLTCDRNAGRFTSIDVDLVHLLCTQVSFALPAAKYFAEQRREREKAECLRRIAFRTAGVASVREAVRAVAEEVSRLIPVDRFFWFVTEEGGHAWVTEIFRQDGIPAARSAHVDLRSGPENLPDLLCGEGGWELQCERLREGMDDVGSGSAGAFGTASARAMSTECPFVIRGEDHRLVTAMRGELLRLGLIDEDAGSCAVVPVQLAHHSRTYLCAHCGTESTYSNDDICFMCLAASAVVRVWLEADAASSLRRLQTTGETMSELAHDFRIPMSKVAMLLKRLATEPMSVADTKESAGLLLRDLESLSALSREFIDLASPGNDKPEFIDLVQVLESSLSLAGCDLGRKSITVEREFASDPPIPPVFASRNDLMRIFINLIANSHEAVEEGGWIKVRTFVDKSVGNRPRVTLTLQDSGPPMAPAIRDSLFTPFKSDKKGGTGLGLFSAKRRANANGGDIIFETADNGMEQFRVWFPAAFE